MFFIIFTEMVFDLRGKKQTTSVVNKLELFYLKHILLSCSFFLEMVFLNWISQITGDWF